jgi:hypothetical protein
MIDGFDQRPRLGWIDEQAVHISTGTPIVGLGVAKERRPKPGGSGHLRANPLYSRNATALDQSGDEVVVYLYTNISCVHAADVNAISAHAVVKVVVRDREGSTHIGRVDQDRCPASGYASCKLYPDARRKGC